MKLSRILSRSNSMENLSVRRHTPWIASPLDTGATGSSSTSEHHEEETKGTKEHTKALKFELPHHHRDEMPPFKHHRESSTIELFYDLFFVANLATFTVNHEIVNADSLKNYIGFFTILWFTWLETSLFDVRFATDSVWNRFCKAISFGVMTGFAITGAIYDTNDVAENVKAFRALSLILMVSRLVLVAQYAVIFFYVRQYTKTCAPLLWTMGALFVSAMIFLGTTFGFSVAGDSFPIEKHGPQTYIAYYIVVCIEATAVITISCIWRVVSFKHTHLVERIGLLTLIIMGEGIIGMTKSVSLILQNSASTSGNDVAVILGSVLLIYFIWVLYFDQIENDRFGTIRQQIWAILHFPLHVAILLTVEGSTELILWNIIIHTDNAWWAWYPVVNYYSEFPKWYKSPEDLIKWLTEGVDSVAHKFKNGTLEEHYNYETNFTSILDINATFGTSRWNNIAGPICDDLFIGIENFIFQNFGIEVPESETSKAESQTSASLKQNNQYYNLFYTVFLYFYIAAGVFLVVLAVLYWFGKQHKSRNEWLSILVRVIAGAGLTLTSLANYYAVGWSGYDFLSSAWPILVVVLGYLVVIVLDNLLVWHGNKTIAKVAGGGQRHGSVRGEALTQQEQHAVEHRDEPGFVEQHRPGRSTSAESDSSESV